MFKFAGQEIIARLTGEPCKLSFANGQAFFWPDTDISAYVGTEGSDTPYQVHVWDNAGKVAIGILGAVGDGGLAISRTMVVDSGSDLPNVDEVLTGATSGAVGTVVTVNDTGGDWGAANGEGEITMNICSGRFHDNEDLNGSVSGNNCCTVNMPDSAAGVDIVQNGEFSVDTDPPPGWVASGATLTTEGVGQVGNCMMLANTGDSDGSTYQGIGVTAGKLVIFKIYFKKGTGASGRILMHDVENALAYKDWAGLYDAAWAAYTYTFVVRVGCETIRIYCYVTEALTGKTAYFDEISFYEISDPPATALKIVSAKNGSTHNWKHIDSGFDYNATNYNIQIMRAR